MAASSEKILVIKLGALGDFIQALGPMAAIRKHHPDARITLLTTAPFESFAQKCGYFDEIWIDEKPGWLYLTGWLTLKKKLNAASFTRVYDLQNNDRTNLYFKLFERKKQPEWVGTAKGASHRNKSPKRTAGHAFEGHVQTLSLAGIEDIEIDTLEWLEEDVARFALTSPYILLVPGSAPSRPEKRLPATTYAELAQHLSSKGYDIVILGSQYEGDIAEEIWEACPAAHNLTGETTLAQIASLAINAAGAIGNDTGPMHLIAATGCPSLTIFSKHSNPVRHAPKGQNSMTIQKSDLEMLSSKEILEAFKPRQTSNSSE